MNSKKLIRELEDKFVEVSQDAIDAMQAQLTEELRPYPNRTTIRRAGVGKTGRIAGSPRDVVDTGELRDSLEVDVQQTANQVVITAEWTAEHAPYIYYGTDKQPPYPWVRIALREFDFKQELER